MKLLIEIELDDNFGYYFPDDDDKLKALLNADMDMRKIKARIVKNSDFYKFAKIYPKLEAKALEIMNVYGLGDYSLDGISVEEINDKILFYITASHYYNGCGTEHEYLTFHLEEIGNDIEYFKTKYKKEVEKKELDKKLAKEKADENTRLQKAAQDKADYERLKLKFES